MCRNNDEKTTVIVFDDNKCEEVVKLDLKNYEIIEVNGETFAKLRCLKYPTTFIECCNILNLPADYELIYSDQSFNENDYLATTKNEINALVALKICRDAYWKIMGDWKPIYNNMNDANVKYVIENNCGTLTRTLSSKVNKFLVFPTDEMCEEFLNNFRNLITICKNFI